MAEDKEYVNRLEVFAVNQADEIELLKAELELWRRAARMAYHYPVHNVHVGPLTCSQCAEALAAYEEAKKASVRHGS